MAPARPLLWFFAVSVAVSAVSADCVDVSRSEWGAMSPRSSYGMMSAASYVFIHHSATSPCYNTNSCAKSIRSFQYYHMNTKRWNDIGYSFLVGGDGKVYEGRGWNHVGAHTYRYNSKAIGICLVGNFASSAPTPVQLAGAQALIRCGVRKGAIKSSYLLRGHRDVSSSKCPGNVLYSIISQWPHFYKTTSTRH